LEKILEAHIKWLRNEPGGKRADLSRADLSGADLSRATLCDANLSGAELSETNLSRANLCRADLSRANLCLSDLSDTNLTGANLRDTVLSPLRQPPDAISALVAAGIPILEGIAYGWRTRYSMHKGNTHYAPGRYTANFFSTCAQTECHPGIYFSSRECLHLEYYEVEKVPCATWVSCVCAAGDKFRTKELWVFEEADIRWARTT